MTTEPATKPALEALESRCADPRIHAYGVTLEAVARLGRILDRSLRSRAGISQGWFEALLRIERSGGFMTMGELADQVVLTSGGVTRLVDRMTEEGLTERRACETDRRVQYVHITTEGRTVLASAVDVHLEDLDRYFMARFTPEEVECLVEAMDRLRQDPEITG